jgi:carbamoyl-phosphate synthase small subunit
VLREGLPFFGICFGNQLLGRALGFPTYKLPFGHRGINQPVVDVATGRTEITSHNHGFAVDAPIGEPTESPAGFGRVEVSHVNLNDNVVEGLNALDIPAFSVQYHPEAAAGPHDANYLFDRFRDLVVKTVAEGLEAAPSRTSGTDSSDMVAEALEAAPANAPSRTSGTDSSDTVAEALEAAPAIDPSTLSGTENA